MDSPQCSVNSEGRLQEWPGGPFSTFNMSAGSPRLGSFKAIKGREEYKPPSPQPHPQLSAGMIAVIIITGNTI